MQLQRRHDLLYDLILQSKDFSERSVIALAPQLLILRGVDQLRRDPYLILSFTDAAFQYVLYAQFLSHVLHLDGFALVGEGSVTGDDK